MALGFFNQYRVTGALLILAFIIFAIGASLPLLGDKGNMGFFGLPEREQLLAIAGNATAWRWCNILAGAAGVILLAGLSMLSTRLESVKELTFSRLGLIGLLLTAILWVIFSAYRATVMTRAAQDLAASGAPGAIPAYYEPLARWGGALFYIYAVIGFLALVAYGLSLLLSGLLPAWSGWATVIFSVAMLILLFIQGDTLPAFHYVPGLLIGALLVFHG
jgi:hypothetical protein